MIRRTRLTAVLATMLAIAALALPHRAHAAAEGQLVWGVHISLVPTYFEPAETAGLVTPFMLLYNEQNVRVRKQLLDRAQQLIYARLVFIPLMGSVFLNGVGSRAEVHGLGLIPNYPYSAPYEDLQLKKK